MNEPGNLALQAILLSLGENDMPPKVSKLNLEISVNIFHSGLPG